PRRTMDTPSVILMLTAREDKEDMTRGLEAGADDFVGKSSDLAVLKARTRALLRRKFFQEENHRSARDASPRSPGTSISRSVCSIRRPTESSTSVPATRKSPGVPPKTPTAIQ